MPNELHWTRYPMTLCFIGGMVKSGTLKKRYGSMLDELEKTRMALDEVIAALQVALEPVLKQANPSTDDAPRADSSQQSELRSQLDIHSEHLDKLRRTIESISNRLDIPT